MIGKALKYSDFFLDPSCRLRPAGGILIEVQ